MIVAAGIKRGSKQTNKQTYKQAAFELSYNSARACCVDPTFTAHNTYAQCDSICIQTGLVCMHSPYIGCEQDRKCMLLASGWMNREGKRKDAVEVHIRLLVSFVDAPTGGCVWLMPGGFVAP